MDRFGRGCTASQKTACSGAQSLVRAFGILDELAKGDSMTLSELSRAVGLPRSTAHRLLTTMEALRYVAFDRQKNGWSTGVQAFTVGAVFAQTRDLGQLGRTIMRSLMTQVLHCVNISVPEGEGVCYVGQAAANGFRQTAARPEAVLPLHTTASGKVLMAQWSRAEFEHYLDGSPLRHEPRAASSTVTGCAANWRESGRADMRWTMRSIATGCAVSRPSSMTATDCPGDRCPFRTGLMN